MNDMKRYESNMWKSIQQMKVEQVITNENRNKYNNKLVNTFMSSR